MLGPNAFIYFALFTALIFIAYSLVILRGLPGLAEIFSLMLSTTAAYSGVELCYQVLEGTKKLGDFQDQKLIIVLGAVAVFWVALLTLIGLVKGVWSRSKFMGDTPSDSPQVENG